MIAVAAPDVVAQVGRPVLGALGATHLILAWFIYRGSRLATVLAILLLPGCIAYAALAGQLAHPRDDVKDAAFPFITLLLLVNGDRSAFARHRMRDQMTAAG